MRDSLDALPSVLVCLIVALFVFLLFWPPMPPLDSAVQESAEQQSRRVYETERITPVRSGD